MPYEWRRDPNAYNYFFKFSRRSARSSTDPERADYQAEEHIECVICMNKIIWEVDPDGVLVESGVPPSAHGAGSQIEMADISNDSSAASQTEEQT